MWYNCAHWKLLLFVLSQIRRFPVVAKTTETHRTENIDSFYHHIMIMKDADGCFEHNKYQDVVSSYVFVLFYLQYLFGPPDIVPVQLQITSTRMLSLASCITSQTLSFVCTIDLSCLFSNSTTFTGCGWCLDLKGPVNHLQFLYFPCDGCVLGNIAHSGSSVYL